mgnify:CR=1 FL=1
MWLRSRKTSFCVNRYAPVTYTKRAKQIFSSNNIGQRNLHLKIHTCRNTTTWRLFLFIFYIVDKVRFQVAGGSTVHSDLLMCVHIVVKTLKIENVMLTFSRPRQRNVLKSAPPVQHDYFSSFNQSYHFPGPFFLLKFLVLTIVKTRKE